MFDQHEQIVSLEAEIDELVEAAERCRRIGLAAKLAIATGLVMIAASTLGLFRFGPTSFVFALSAVLGGIALSGSNKRTWDDTRASLQVRQAQRAELIDALGLESVGVGEPRPERGPASRLVER